MTEPFSTAVAAGRRLGRDLPATVVLALLGAYKVLFSQLYTGSCRFQPPCSDYMAEAVRRHGATQGTWLGLRRLTRCRPYGGHGFDPVPPSRKP